jgi:putative MFS transporter
MGPLQWRVLALVAAGYFFDVLDFTIFGALVPDLIHSGFVTQQQVPWIGSITLLGLFIGTLGQGEFTDRFGRKTVYQFNLLLFGVATIVAALPPIPSIGFEPGLTWLLVFRFLAGVGLGAEQPLCFSYTAEYAPKRIRGRVIALMQFIGGAWPWPVGVLLTLALRDRIGWRGIWIIVGIGALIIFILRFSLPESPRWLRHTATVSGRSICCSAWAYGPSRSKPCRSTRRAAHTAIRSRPYSATIPAGSSPE